MLTKKLNGNGGVLWVYGCAVSMFWACRLEG